MINKDGETQNEEGEPNYEDDDLGYYPDGVKRTLTNEQIAMFRHSEIYSLVRKREIQNETRDIDEHVDPGPLHQGSTPYDVVNMRQELDVGDGDSNDDGEYLKFLEAEKRQMEADRKQTEAEHNVKKRKFNRINGSKPHHRAPTHRRMARELDAATISHDLLDYGEETSEIPDHLKEHPHDDDNQGLKEMNSETLTTIHTTSANILHDPPKGRKIWWPTIEGQ